MLAPPGFDFVVSMLSAHDWTSSTAPMLKRPVQEATLDLRTATEALRLLNCAKAWYHY